MGCDRCPDMAAPIPGQYCQQLLGSGLPQQHNCGTHMAVLIGGQVLQQGGRAVTMARHSLTDLALRIPGQLLQE